VIVSYLDQSAKKLVDQLMAGSTSAVAAIRTATPEIPAHISPAGFIRAVPFKLIFPVLRPQS
jgi:hypothetical protein